MVAGLGGLTGFLSWHCCRITCLKPCTQADNASPTGMATFVATCRTCQAMVASLGGLTGFLSWHCCRITCLKPCTQADNASPTGMATFVATCRTCQAMVASLGGLTGFLSWHCCRITCLKPCTQADNASPTGMATFVATCRTCQAMVASLGGLTGFLSWHCCRITCLKPCTQADNASPTGMATLQQMWERACPAKRRAGGARFAPPLKTQADHLPASMQSPRISPYQRKSRCPANACGPSHCAPRSKGVSAASGCNSNTTCARRPGRSASTAS